MEHLKKIEKELREKGARLTELLNLGSHTSEQGEEMKTLTEVIPSLKADIESLQKATGVLDWMTEVRGTLPPVAPQGAATVATSPDGSKSVIVEEDDPSPISAKQMNAISEPGYKRDWCKWMRSGQKSIDLATYKAMQEGRDDYGGYLVPADMMMEIIKRSPHPSSILSNVRRLQCGRDLLKIPMHKYATDDIYSTGARIQWTGEGGTTSEDTSLQNWGMREIPIHEGTFDIQMSRSMAEDTFFDVGSFISEEAASAYELEMDKHIVSATGNGVAKPSGMLLDPGGTDRYATTNVGNPVGGDGIMDLVGALPAQYRANAKFLSNSSTVWADLAQIKAGSNEYIGLVKEWSQNTLGAPRVDAILGFPLMYSAFMPAAAGAANILLFGDFQRGYGFVERVGLTAYPYGDQDRAMLTAGLLGVMFRCRVGGDRLQSRAIRIGVQS